MARNTHQDGSGFGVYGQRYAADGSVLGGEFRLNATTAGNQIGETFYGSETVAQLADGRLVSVWAGTGAEEVFARVVELPADAGVGLTVTGLELVSVSTTPGVTGDSTSDSVSRGGSSVSADGRFVAFTSYASDLVVGDTNSASDVFVRDMQTGITTIVSVGVAGQGNSFSSRPSISADGRFVTFSSLADNLVAGDTNGSQDVYVRDLQTGITTLVSTGAAGQANGNSPTSSISADGRFVAFDSVTTNLVSGDTNGSGFDVFVRDLQTGTTTLVSTGADGQGNASSFNTSISSDGRFVTFSSSASNLVSGDNNSNIDIFVRDLQTGTTTLVSTGSAGQSNGHSGDPTVSADGRFVAFYSEASNLVAGDTNGRSDIFVRDLQTGTTTLVSTGPAGQGNDSSYSPSISADGRFVAFYSYADNLVAGDTNDRYDVFVRDLQTGTTKIVSTGPAGQGNSYFPAQNDPFPTCARQFRNARTAGGGDRRL